MAWQDVLRLTAAAVAVGVRDEQLSFHMSELGGSFHFIRFETRRTYGALKLARTHGLHVGMKRIYATGGGAIKFAPLAREMIGVELEPRDEIDCLVKGMAFLMAHVNAEAYTFRGNELEDRPMAGIEYPYLLVNIGSGVGFILVKSENEWQRVSGTSLGGGTYYGICHMITNMTSFDEMLNLAEVGDNSNVDLTVGDIYGGEYGKFGLKASTIASSFGKAITWTHPERKPSAPVPHRDFMESVTGRGITRTEATNLSAHAARPGAGFATPLVPSSAPHADATRRASHGEALSAGAARMRSPSQTRRSSESDLSTLVRAISSASGSGVADIPAPDPLSHSARVDLSKWPLNSAPAEVTLMPDPTADAPAPLRTNSSEMSEAASNNTAPLADSARLHEPRPSSISVPTSSPRAEGVRPIRSPSYGDPFVVHAQAPAAQDVSRALLIMLSNNIGQLAYLIAEKYRCKHVYFAGNFLRHENTVAMRTLAFAITYWSQGAMEGLFLRHEGYCGALGAFLSTLEAAEEV